jgi:hypothetical protein|mmetsp:Transcript_26008/g.41284  ORF Transcript_26008/g.41284 Transcript_26008/m.41284 type:complete len:333 (+) Transcript_26008:161-1159(+)
MEELLTKIGLDRFVSTFQDEDMDLEALSLCEEADLKDLGLTKGPRVKLLRALQGIFPKTLEPIPDNIEKYKSDIDDLTGQLGSLSDRFVSMEQQMGMVEKQVASTCDELAAVVSKQNAVDSRLALGVHHEEPEAEGKAEGTCSGELDDDEDELWEQVQDLAVRLNAMQELAPSRLCWNITNIAEKLSVHGPGKCLRAPSFALCSCIVGMKLEFYPNGRNKESEDRSLPEITPREHPALKEVRRQARPIADRISCSIGICCPMGVKLQYTLQIGRTQKFDSCHVDWSTAFHDFRMRWKEELENDESLLIVLTAVRVHNKRLKVKGDTVWVQSE